MKDSDGSSFPEAFRSADQLSLRGQADARRRVQATLVLVVVGAACGLVTWRVSGLDVFGGVALVAFVGSGALNASRRAEQAEARWYRGRAVAESAKTLAWRYAVGGHPFPVGLPGADADGLLHERLTALSASAADLGLEPGVAGQITADMAAARRQSFEERRALYLAGRIEGQRLWYEGRAEANTTVGRRWAFAATTANVAGGVAALVTFLGVFEVELLGLAAAVAGAATAWTQFRQHRALAVSYGVAAGELAGARGQLVAVDREEDWAGEVAGAEEAISREHTMWLARSGRARRIR